MMFSQGNCGLASSDNTWFSKPVPFTKTRKICADAFVESPSSILCVLQAQFRAHRLGQRFPQQIWHLFGEHTIQRYQEYVNLRKFRAQMGAELDPRVVLTATQARAQQLAPEARAAKEQTDLTVRSAIFDAHESIVEREVVEDLIDALTVRWFEPPQKLKLSPLAPAGFPNQQADNDSITLCTSSLY